LETVWRSRGNVTEEYQGNLPRPIWEVLSVRGIGPNQIENYLKPSLKDLRDPMSLADMDRVVDRLQEAFVKNDKICVYGDYDLDGSSGLVLLKEGLTNLGFNNVHHYQPKRLAEGYGVHPEAISLLAAQGVKVVVTVDVGITAFEACARAREENLDLIITDHHLPGEVLPDAFAVVNPNRGDCPSGLGYLSGTGVGFYLILALWRRLISTGQADRDFDPKHLLDSFAIGTLTDMVPLKQDNRVLVKHGLRQLSKTKKPGLRLLLSQLDLCRPGLSSQDVVFNLAPKLNALSRLEMGLAPVDVYLAGGEKSAMDMVSQVLATNEKRKSLQAKAERIAMGVAAHEFEKGFLWIWSPLFHKGIVGLVATKLSQKFMVPAFVGSLAEDGIIVGSARVPEGCDFNILEVLKAGRCHLDKFGGHAMAAGFSVKKNRGGTPEGQF